MRGVDSKPVDLQAEELWAVTRAMLGHW